MKLLSEILAEEQNNLNKDPVKVSNEALTEKFREITYHILDGETGIECDPSWHSPIQEMIDATKVLAADPETTWAQLQDPEVLSTAIDRKMFDYACRIYRGEDREKVLEGQIPAIKLGVVKFQQKIISLAPSPYPRST